MSGLFLFLAFAAFTCTIIGFIDPKIIVFWSKNKNRKMSSVVYGLAFVLFLILAGSTAGPSTTSVPTASSVASSRASLVSSSVVSKSTASSSAVQTALSVNQTITDGYYTVGTDIPAGTYNFSAVEGYGNVITTDGEINEIMGESGSKTYNNAKLILGQVLSVSGVKLEITSSNASGAALKQRNQSGLVTKQLSAGNYTVGTDFPAGTYDLSAVSGEGNVICNNGIIFLNAVLSTEPETGLSTSTYKNVTFKAGNVLKISQVTISITPSK